MSGTHDKYVLSTVNAADAADWTLHLDGLQAMYTDESGNVYYCKYELVETSSSGFTVTYENNAITYEDTNYITIINTESDNGALSITKLVAIKGMQISDYTQPSSADGDYVFSVAGPDPSSSIVKFVKITVTNGKMVSYKVAAENTDSAWGNAESKSGTKAIVEDLEEGDYVVTELAVEGMSVSSITGGKESLNGNDGTTNDASLTNRTVTVHVTAGDSEAARPDAAVTFTNNKSLIDLTIIKIDETTRGAASQTKLPSAEFQLFKYTVSGTSSSYTAYPNLDESKQTTSTEGDSFGTLTFGNLPDGQYKISETVPPAGYLKVENNDIYFDIVSGAITRYDKGVNEADRAVIEEDRNTANITYSKIDKSFTVGNIPGAALPQTGGIGTTLFTALGGLMTATAGAILTIRWKRKPTEG